MKILSTDPQYGVVVDIACHTAHEATPQGLTMSELHLNGQIQVVSTPSTQTWMLNEELVARKAQRKGLNMRATILHV